MQQKLTKGTVRMVKIQPYGFVNEMKVKNWHKQTCQNESIGPPIGVC